MSRFLGMLLLLLSGLWHGAALAAQPFSMDRFEALQDAGEVILVEIFADWCPTCARQGELLAAYREARPDAELHILKVDFDKQKEWVRHFRAPRQSTLILYQGHEQQWFSVAETRKDVIFDQLDRVTGAH